MIVDTPWMPRLVPTATLGGAVAASTAEVTAGTDNTKFITPAALEGSNPAFAGGTVPAQVAASANAKALRPGIAFDGSTGQRATSTLTGQTIGTDPVSVVMTFRVPTTAATQGLWFLSANATTNNQARGFFAELRATGELYVTLIGATTANARTAQVASVFTNYGGKTIVLAVTKSSSGLAIYVNGVVQSQGAETTVGTTPPAWADTVTGTYLTWGTNSAGGTEHLTASVYGISLYNLALSAADVLEIAELGGAVPFRYQYGSQADINTATIANVDFTTFSGASATGFTAAAASGSKFASVLSSLTVAAGQQWRAKGTLTLNGGKTVVPDVLVESSTRVPLGTGGAFSVTFSSEISGSGKGLFISSVGDASFTIAGLAIERLGAVCHFACDEGIGYQLHDASTNKLDAQISLTGVSHLVPRVSGWVRGTLTWAGTNTLQTLSGGPSLPPGGVMRDIHYTMSAGTTGTGIIIENAVTAGWWASRVSRPSAGKYIATLANRLPTNGGASANDRYINVSPDSVNYTGSVEVVATYDVTSA